MTRDGRRESRGMTDADNLRDRSAEPVRACEEGGPEAVGLKDVPVPGCIPAS